MNHNFDFQGCQKMHIRVAISQKGLIGLFANCCHLMLLGPKEWKHKSKVLRTHFKNFFNPGTLCQLYSGGQVAICHLKKSSHGRENLRKSL